MNKELPVINPEWFFGIMMTKAQKDQWLAALRSGEYEQGAGRLSDCPKLRGGTFCCMGVAEDQGLAKRNSHYYLEEGFIGPPIKGLQELLSDLNDSGDWSFVEIADFIEKNIPACDAAVKS